MSNESLTDKYGRKFTKSATEEMEIYSGDISVEVKKGTPIETVLYILEGMAPYESVMEDESE